MSKRAFIIFTSDGARTRVEAPTLRTALRNSGSIESKSAIVAAIEEGCLPVQPREERPFLAVLLTNPAFNKPEWPQ